MVKYLLHITRDEIYTYFYFKKLVLYFVNQMMLILVLVKFLINKEERSTFKEDWP